MQTCESVNSITLRSV